MKNEEILTISTKKLKEKKDLNPELIIINVLDEKIYNDCHISGSKNIPLDQIVQITSSWDKNKEIIVYCASPTCSKSEQAYHILKDLGFCQLFQYPGGMKKWLQEGYEVSGSCRLDYLKEL